LGVPIVSTSMAVEGLPDELSKYILVAENEKDFANFVIKILKNPETYRSQIQEGKNVINEMLDWKNIVSNFENYLRNKLSGIT
jgi:glycosyltransferase involved in cell wall biosynthesis